MNNVVCLKCGTEAISKCPTCRNVFPQTNKMASLISGLLSVDFESQGKYRTPDLVVRLTHFHNDKCKDGEVTLGEVNELIEALTYYRDNFSVVTCNHHWQFKPGQSSSIGCGHGVV